MANLELYEDDDTTLVAAFPVASERGAWSPTYTVHLWNDLGNDLGQLAENVALIDETESPTTPGVYQRADLPPQDEHWRQWRIVGYDNTGDPSWTVASTAWASLGAYRRALIGDIPANCAVYLELRERPPAAGPATTYAWKLTPIYAEASLPVPPSTTAAGRGILTGVGDYGRTHVVRGVEVTASSPADDEVHVSGGLVLFAGLYAGRVTTDHQLNQTAADGALASGESYIAAVTVGADGVVTVTKGNKAATPTKPTPPAGEKVRAWVTVEKQSGASVIETADIEIPDALWERYDLVAGAGLDATQHAGRAVGGDTYRYHTAPRTLTFDASSTSYVWQLADGSPAITTATDPPADAALGPWHQVVTDGSGITSIVDLRTYADDLVVLHLRGTLPGSPGEVASLLVQHERLQIERLVYRISDNGGGASGQTKLDTKRAPVGSAAATLYTSHATEDTRPTFPHDASTLTNDGSTHEECDLRRGDLLTLESLEHPTGGTPDWAEVYLLCRRP
jgi:hypothetical protein